VWTARTLLLRMPLRPRRRLLYFRQHRRLPNLRSPVRFTEKVNKRILEDRRDALRPTCDKLAMKEYAERACSEVSIPQTVWSGTDVRELEGLSLPERWVLKPNHRSGLVYFGSGQVASAADLLRMVTEQDWLGETRNAGSGEWAYGVARRALLVEEAIGEPGRPPDDYKFFVFDGIVRLIQVDTNRFVGHLRRMYRPDWTPLPHRYFYPLAEVIDPPPHLSEMLDIASRIGGRFDFIRVDLYDMPEAVWFGEITPYPDSGLGAFDPPDLDIELGSYWRMPSYP
jgi:hypothetical protein